MCLKLLDDSRPLSPECRRCSVIAGVLSALKVETLERNEALRVDFVVIGVESRQASADSDCLLYTSDAADE